MEHVYQTAQSILYLTEYNAYQYVQLVFIIMEQIVLPTLQTVQQVQYGQFINASQL